MAIPAERDADPLVTFDWTDCDSVSTAVLTAVSAVAGEDALTGEPLYETIDPDALDALFAPTRSRGWVTFEFHGHPVVVDSDGSGYVYDPGDPPAFVDRPG